MGENEKVISLSHITKDYGNGKGVFDISFDIAKGEIFGYLGPNGAGKTTTIRQLMGFIHSDSGTCNIFGMDCFSKAAQIQKVIGYLAGEIAFMDDMTGIKYLDFIADMRGMKEHKRKKELIDMFELDPGSRIKKMSKGMKQKIGIICAFMDLPEAVILDEPTSGLDPLMQNRFIELILEEKKKGTTVLMSSHIFEEVEKTCDRTAIIRQGKIAVIEDMESLAGKRKKIFEVTLKDEYAAARMADSGKFNINLIAQNIVQIKAGNDLSPLLKDIAEFAPLDIDIKKQSLEELFLHYYGEEGAK